MHDIDRSSLRGYAQTIMGLTDEELCREIWMLEEHIKYLSAHRQDSTTFRTFLTVSKEEKEVRMVAQGYQ
jgi:hypothetical protein